MGDNVQIYVTSDCAEEGYAGRIGVVTGLSSRRRWPEHVKAEIVLESYRVGYSVAICPIQFLIEWTQLNGNFRAEIRVAVSAKSIVPVFPALRGSVARTRFPIRQR